MALEDWVDPINRLIKNNEEVSEYFEAVKEIVDFLSDEESWSKVKSIEDFFNRSIVKHFNLEEEIIFPVILSKCGTPESIKLILELQREHGSILKQLEEFQKIIENVFPFDEETKKARLTVVAREIMESLLSHASKEDDRLLSILKENIKLF